MTEIEQLKQRIALLEEFVSSLKLSDRYMFQKNIQIMDGRNIQLGIGTGTKLGTSASQKLSIYGVAPVVQAGAISSPTGGGSAGVDTPARTAIDSIRVAIKNFGITA